MKRIILGLISCLSVGQVYCQDVSAFAFGAATPVLAAGATAGVSWMAGSYIGRPTEAASLGAIGAIALFECCFARNEDESVDAYRRALNIFEPTGTQEDRTRRAQAAYRGEKYAKIGSVGIALYFFGNALYNKYMFPDK